MTARKTYYLDLQTLLKLLRNKSGTLTAKIKIDGQWGEGYISFRQGQVEQSTIKWPKGQMDGKKAFELLSAVQEWQVGFETTPPAISMSPATSSSSGAFPAQPQSFSPAMPQSFSPAPPQPYSPSMPTRTPAMPIIPRIRVELNSFMLDHYTPQQRTVLQTVYSVIDGHKNIDQIKAQLNIPPHIVDSALIALQQLGTIAW